MVGGGKLVTLFRHTECTDPNSEFWHNVFDNLGEVVITVEELEGLMMQRHPPDKATKNRLLRLLEAQFCMRMFVWEDDEGDSSWHLVEAAMGTVPPDQPEPE